MTENLRERLADLYDRADADVRAAGPRCDASGRCCRFREYGHTLFISTLEADYLLESAPQFDRPVDDSGCPFQIGGLCTARDHRPLGCRLYFCDPGYQETGSILSEKYIAELKRLSTDEQVPWRYAPLHVFLNDEPPTSGRCERTASTVRTDLPERVQRIGTTNSENGRTALPMAPDHPPGE